MHDDGEVEPSRQRAGHRVGLGLASPPTVYLSREDVAIELLQPTDGHTVCEWKGKASYFDVKHEGGRVECYLDDERVRPQAGSFYESLVSRR